MRPLALTCALALALGGALRPPAADVPARRANLERRSALLEAWEASDLRRRDAAVRVLAKHRKGAERPSSSPRAEALTEALRILVRDEDAGEPLSATQRFVDSLDLRVVPGLYQGRPEGKPQPLVVRVVQLYHVPLEHAVEVSLIWISESGEEHRARTEPVVPAAFLNDGFEMFVRAPSNVPGAWSLVCEVAHHDVSARGIPVPVYGLDAFEDVVRTLEPDVRRELDALVETGLRPAFPRAFLEGVGLVATHDTARWSGARSTRLPFESLSGLEQGALWHVGVSDTAPDRVVLFLPPEDEDPQAVFIGPGGAAWSSFARDHDAWLISCDLPLRRAEGASFFSLARELAAFAPEAEVQVVVRGAGLLQLALAFRDGSEPPFDGLLVSCVLASNREPRNLPAARGLLVVSEAEAAADVVELGTNAGSSHAASGEWSWVRRTHPWIVTDLELPALFSAWLRR